MAPFFRISSSYGTSEATPPHGGSVYGTGGCGLYLTADGGPWAGESRRAAAATAAASLGLTGAAAWSSSSRCVSGDGLSRIKGLEAGSRGTSSASLLSSSSSFPLRGGGSSAGLVDGGAPRLMARDGAAKIADQRQLLRRIVFQPPPPPPQKPECHLNGGTLLLYPEEPVIMMRYWGEIPGPAGAPPSRSSFDLLQREFRSVEVQDPPLHQPSAQRPRPTTMLDIPSEPCSLTIHTVQLCQHVRRLRSLLTAAQTQGQGSSTSTSDGGNRTEEGDANLPLRPPTPPAMPDDLLPLDSKAPRQPFQLRHSDPESDFYKGKGEPVTELSWPSCRQLLYQSVATVLAHAGFQSAQESVLETLTDLVHEHYLRLSRLLRVAVDREARVGASPFPDVVEQVFHEAGIGSVLSLQRFWQVRIKDYHSYMLQNRFAPLLQDPDSPKERSSSSTGERYEAKSYTKRLQKELTTGPQTLIVGDGAVNKTKHFFSKNTKVLCFTNDMVSNISEKILEITAEHPTVKSLVIHTGALDVVKQKSEVLKRDFNDLLNKVRCLNTEVFISGPLPTVRRGDERFSRLLMLNRWLKDTCAVNFIDNFNIFWERRHLFEADGFCLNKSGLSKDLSEEYERLVNPEKALEDSKPPRIKEEPMSDISFPVSEEPEADLASGDQALPMGVLGAHGERLPAGLEGDHSPHASGGGRGGSPSLWPHVKMEPQDGEEGQGSSQHHHHHHHHHHPHHPHHHHHHLGGDVFEEGGPMSTMSESGGAMAPSPTGGGGGGGGGGGASDGSYASHSPDSLMDASPVFNQRARKRAKKM
ncbi:STAGA complex 65 subunit gamma [Merluccius polli]|uniref:STAGA complex 65 subunit gamma n=1 Tax=Merluccius polli TaxID=89951 RepID=A0AA47NZ10_MERPO|nr:STAGA complex 65 subunit gamma [Merluccius polli]